MLMNRFKPSGYWSSHAYHCSILNTIDENDKEICVTYRPGLTSCNMLDFARVKVNA